MRVKPGNMEGGWEMMRKLLVGRGSRVVRFLGVTALAASGLAVWHLAGSQHFAGPQGRYWLVADRGPGECPPQWCLTPRHSLLSGVSLHELLIHAAGGCPRPDGLSAHASTSSRAAATASASLSIQHPAFDRNVETVLFSPEPHVRESIAYG